MEMDMWLSRVRVRVRVEGAAPPAGEEPDREAGDQEADRGLRATPDGVRQIRTVEHDRHAQGEERERVARAPGEPELRRVSRAPFGRRDQRRHGGQVVGVGGVPEPEEYGDRNDDEKRRTVGERRQVAVEAEHQSTPGRALTVMPIPTTRITSALTAGRAWTRRPSSRSRPKAFWARTATRPIAVIVAARPALKATMSASPSPIRWRAIADRRTTSAEGQGRSPAATPTPRRPPRP